MVEYDHLRKRRRGPWRTFFVLCFWLAVILTAVFVWRVASFSEEQESDQVQQPPQEEKFYGINGAAVSKELSLQRPIAVMVENHVDSRPQSGLSRADIVYEALAEGGITRFLALYQTREAKTIGPIRSARDYYAEIANSWGSLYAHVGGSPEVLENIKQGEYSKLTDLNEFFNGKYFERKTSRFAPHNVYSSTATLYSFLKDKNEWQKPSEPYFIFSDDAGSSGTVAAPIVNISFSTAPFALRYEYDQSQELYNRFIAGKKDIDYDTNEQIRPKTVIVQMVKVTDVPNDPALRVNIDLASGGKAYVFKDGKVIEGTWKKESSGKTRFLDASGSEIAVKRGQLWIELVPTTKQSELNWKPAVSPPPSPVAN